MAETKVEMKKSATDDFNIKGHWENIYSTKNAEDVSWYQKCPEYSLDLIKATCVEKTARIIDVGGGASTLVDYLLDYGFENLSVLDIANTAIEQAKTRLGTDAGKIEWLVQDATNFAAEDSFDLWHDRAVFHFLTSIEQRLRYVKTMCRMIDCGGHAIIATFGLDGPEKCSGIDIVRYSPESMAAILGDSFKLVETCSEKHKTPSGNSQSFVYCKFVRV